MYRSRHRLVPLSGIAVLILLLMACGGDSEDEVANLSPSTEQPTLPAESTVRSVDDNAALDADGDGLYNMSEYEQAIQLAFESYKWPGNYVPTVNAMLASLENAPPGEEHLFEVGLEYTKIGTWHQCAWYMAWLDAFRSGDIAVQAEALEVMIDVIPSSPVLGPDGVQVLSQIAETAALGDPSEVISMIEGLRCNDLSFG